MFQEPPMLYYVVPKNKHYILSGLATMLTMFGTAVVGLSIGTDHWREASNPGHNLTIAIQGLVHECDKKSSGITCIDVKQSRFIIGLIGVLEIVYGLLLESLILGLLALIASLAASFHKKATLVTAVVAMEIVSGIMTLIGVSCYTHYFLKDPWHIGWSYGLAWLNVVSLTIASILHYIVQDTKFLGKKICT
eukprot:Seg782.6 transcript_id=Seg782.6/GoldUCD/mRNA.D3Y31 product="hypothetical protein" protein_id=Seg782.6/GoldUCD/D3Y31